MNSSFLKRLSIFAFSLLMTPHAHAISVRVQPACVAQKDHDCYSQEASKLEKEGFTVLGEAGPENTDADFQIYLKSERSLNRSFFRFITGGEHFELTWIAFDSSGTEVARQKSVSCNSRKVQECDVPFHNQGLRKLSQKIKAVFEYRNR